MKKRFCLACLFSLILLHIAGSAVADEFYMYDRYIEIMGVPYGLGTPVGKFAANGWQDTKRPNGSNKFLADLDGIAKADTYANPYIEFSKDGYNITVWAYASELKQDTPVKDLIIQKIEIISDFIDKKNQVPWTLENGFNSRDKMKRMLELYPNGILRDEDERNNVDAHYAENSYRVLLNSAGISANEGPDVWAALTMRHKNGRREVMLEFQTLEYLSTPQGRELYMQKN